MKKLLGLLLVFILLVIIVILLFNTLTVHSKQSQVVPVEPMSLNTKAIGRLAQAIKLPTVSTPVMDTTAFKEFKTFIKQKFATIFTHTAFEHQYINEFSSIIKWNGRNPNKKPVLFLAHQDVLDPDLKTIPEWSYNPFLGKLKNDKIWGRGTIEGKVSVLAILEALKLMIAENWVPERTLYCVFTHDSYQTTEPSAKAVAWMFQQAGIEFELGLATGNGLFDEGIMGVEQPMALVGIAAKNSINIKLKAKNKDLTTLKNASQRLETSILHNDLNRGIANDFWRYLAPEMPFNQRLVATNLWLLEWVAQQNIIEDKVAQAALQSTIELEKLQKKNTKPVEGLLQTQLLVDWTKESLEAQLKEWIGENTIELEVLSNGAYARQRAPTTGYSFELLQTTIKEVFANLLVIPTTRFKNTDASYFSNLTDKLYYFSPIKQTTQTLLEPNPIDDAIGFKNYQELIQFYYQLIKNTTK